MDAVTKIYIQLLKMGFNPNRIGALYLAEAIAYSIENPEIECLGKDSYKFLYRKHRKKLATIRSNVLHACIDASKKTQKNITPKRTAVFLVEYNISHPNLTD